MYSATTAFCPAAAVPFAHRVPTTGPPTAPTGLAPAASPSPFCLIHRRAAPKRRRRGPAHVLRMGSDRPWPRTDASGGAGGGSASAVLPEGAFTLVLTVRIKPDIAPPDARSLLTEYGRATVAEPHVVRCDVVFEVDKRNRPRRGAFYQIWTTFQDARAYMEHERTPHATKLRLYLENPSGGDNAVLLTKLGFDVALLRPVRPALLEWRSSLDVDLLPRAPPPQHPHPPYPQQSQQQQQQQPHYPASQSARPPPPPSPPPQPLSSRTAPNGEPISPEEVDRKRRDLDRLISSVGLDNVKIITASATARSQDDVPAVRDACAGYLANLERSPGIVRTGLLVNRTDPRAFVILTVHDADDPDGAFFDLELAVDQLTSPGWNVKRLCSIFPDKIGWERAVDEAEAVRMGILPPPPPTPPPIVKKVPADKRIATHSDDNNENDSDSDSVDPEAATADAENDESERSNSARSEDRKSTTVDDTAIDLVPESQSATLGHAGAPTTEAAPRASQVRLVHGVSAFDKLTTYLRELVGRPTGPVRVLFVHGWNPSRLQPVMIQLDEDRELKYSFGLGILSCEVSTASLRRGVEAVREADADVLLALGGGSVMDMAKALSLVAKCDDAQLDSVISAIDTAAEQGAGRALVPLDSPPIPVLLIPNNAGPGAELTEFVVFGRKNDDVIHALHRWKRLPVFFVDADETAAQQQQQWSRPVTRLALSDPRLIAGRRLGGKDAATGALSQTCLAFDVLLSVSGDEDDDVVEGVEDRTNGRGSKDGRKRSHISSSSKTRWLALDVLGASFRTIRAARREPDKSSGVTRDALAKARCQLGMAIDQVGRPGVCTRLALAVIDSLVDGRSSHIFREVLARVTAAVAGELSADGLDGVAGDTLRSAARMMDVDGKVDVQRQLLRRADELDVPLLRRVGMVQRRNIEVAAEVARNLREIDDLSDVERLFCEARRVERVLNDAIEQWYEL